MNDSKDKIGQCAGQIILGEAQTYISCQQNGGRKTSLAQNLKGLNMPYLMAKLHGSININSSSMWRVAHSSSTPG